MCTATPNAIYTQQAAKPACQEDIDAKFSHLLLAQLPQTQFTHSKAPNPHASKTSTQNFRTSYWHSYPERNLHTASRQTRMPGRHRRKIFAAPIGTATPNAIYTQQAAKPACQQDINAKFSQLLLAQLPRTQFTHSKAPNPHASNASTQNFRSSYWHSYPERNLHTARLQTRVPATHPHKIFAAPIGAATPSTIYTQQGAKPACQQRIHTKFSQLLLAQLPRTPFTHSKAPNPHASNTSAQNFRSSYWHSYPEHHLHTARPQTRMPATHPHKIFAAPIGAATPNTIYTQQGAKPACQQHISTKFSQLLLAQLPRTPFTHSKAPNPHASNASTQNFRSSYWHSYPEHNLHTARLQTRMPATHPHKIFAAPIGAATPNTICTQQGAKPACQEDINTQKQRQSGGDQTTPKRTSDPLRMLQVPRLPRKSSDTAAETKRRQSVHQIPCRCSKSHACHAKAATEPRRPNDAKAYIRSLADAPSPTPATQKQRQSGGDQTTPKRTSDPLQMHRVPRLPRKSSGKPAETKQRQSVHQTPCRCSMPHACHAKAAADQRRPNDAKAYIRFPADAPSPTPATQKQRQSGGDQTTPKRTSDPLQMLQAPRLPRKSSDRAAETKRRQSVHQIPCRCSKSHACHAKATAERRRPNDAKAYIRPPADAPCPTPATQKQRQTSGDQTTPKRTSDPLQMHQVPRLPHKSSGRTAETKRRQSVHHTPCRCSKSHACHAKAAAERRRPNDAKAYIRPPADAPSPTPATQKQRQSGGDQTTPKRTSDPLQMLQVPRLPRKSSGRAAETKRRQSVHQTPCRCSKSHACHAKAAAERRRPNDAKAYIRPPADAPSPTPATQKQRRSGGDQTTPKHTSDRSADAPSPTPATQKQRQSGGDQTTPKRTSDPLQMLHVPRLPRKSSGRAAETKRRQSVHQTPCRCSKSHACHAKAAAERRRPNDAKAYIRPPADAPCPTPATQKQRQSGGDQTTPKRTSDPLQMLQVPRLPRKSSDRAAETKRRQSVHQTPCRCTKSHACHAKAAAERRRPNDAKAYIGPPADAPSPTPATQKQRQSGGDQTTPKRTSDPLQMLQVPRLPRKSSGRAAETKRRQSVHQTPCRCSKSHACHAKVSRCQAVWCQAVWCQAVWSQAVWCQAVWSQAVWGQAVWCQAVWCQAVWCQAVSRCQAVWCQAVWCQAVWSQAVWCQAVWSQAVWGQAVWCQAVWCQAVWCQAVRCEAVWCEAVWCQAVWCQAVRCEAVWCEAVWCQAVWCQAVWCEAVWCEAAWYQPAWCQPAWCQPAWC